MFGKRSLFILNNNLEYVILTQLILRTNSIFRLIDDANWLSENYQSVRRSIENLLARKASGFIHR